jgi:8-oxo-dGTP pyrophosphatase MutT (NUDIX family)
MNNIIDNSNLSKQSLLDLFKSKVLDPLFKKDVQVTAKNYADTLLINEDGKLLVLLRSNSDDFEPGMWSLPGGKIEADETPLAGAIRELSEETNIDVEELEEYKIINKDNCTINYFIGSVDSDDFNIILDNNEHQGYEWIDINDIPEKSFLLDLGSFLKESFDVKEKEPLKHAVIDISDGRDDYLRPQVLHVEILSKAEQIQKSMDTLKAALDSEEIDDATYFTYKTKLNIIKSNYESQFEIRGDEADTWRMKIIKSDIGEDLSAQFNDYLSNAFYYNSYIYDNEGLRIPMTTKQVQDALANYPAIYKVDNDQLDDFESNKKVLDGLPRKRFQQVLPVINEYDSFYSEFEDVLSNQFDSEQTDVKGRVKSLKKAIKNTFSTPALNENVISLLSFMTDNVNANIDPLLEITIEGEEKKEVKQIFVSELKELLNTLEPTDYLGITNIIIVDLAKYSEDDLNIKFYEPDTEINIQTIHNKVKNKLAKRKDDLIDLKKSWDEGDISDTEYFDITKSKRYELVKVMRGGKVFYQNRLIGTDKLEEDLPESESFADDKTGLEVKRYSDKSILITGNTYANIDLLRKIKTDVGYGTWNKALSGWVYPYFAKEKVFAALAEKMNVGTYDETVAQENVIAAKDAVDIDTPVTVDGVESVVTGIEANNGEIDYEVQPTGTPDEPEEAKQEVEDPATGKRGRKSVAVGTISDDGKRIKTADGWEYIKTKKKEKEIGIAPATDIKAEDLIQNADESNRFQAGKEIFGKQEGEPSVKEEIEEEVKAVQTKAEIKEITTRSGETVQALDYSFVKPTDIQLIDQDNVLETRPYWCPVINEKVFTGQKDNNFVFDYVKLDDDKILLATNGFEKKSYKGDITGARIRNAELKADMEADAIPFYQRRNIVNTINDATKLYQFTLNGKVYKYDDKESLQNDVEAINNNQEADYAVVSVEQLVAIQDFYVKKRKADIELRKEADTLRSVGKLKKMIDDGRDLTRYKIWDYKTRLSKKQQEKYTPEQWDALTVDEKLLEVPNMKNPPIELGKGNRITPLDDNTMWKSNFDMYKKYVDKEYKTPFDRGVRGYDLSDPAAFEYKEVRDLLKWKKLDLQIQREENLNSYAKGLETSYGDSNTLNDLLETHGVKIKTQNGKAMSDAQKIQIEEALGDVYKSFGDRSSMAKKFGLKISHSGEKLMFARQALGLYVPSMKAIGVSNNQEHDKFGFTLAHEYAHFVDNYLGTQSDRHFASDNHNSTAGKIAYKFREIMNKGKFTDSDYANRTCECFARALEQYHAMEIEGEDAIKSKRNNKAYHLEDGHVNQKDFNAIIKPMIEQFFVENNELLKSLANSNDIQKSTDEPFEKDNSVEGAAKENSSVEEEPKMTKQQLKDWAKNTPLEDLEAFIKLSDSPELRKYAHEEVARREKEEHVKDKPIKKADNPFIL